MKFDWFDITNEDRNKSEGICPPEEYRVTETKILSGVLPDALINQYNSEFVMGFKTANGYVYYMANGNWVDYWDSGTASYYPLPKMPTAPRGKITDLRMGSQNATLGKLVEVLKNQVHK